MKPAPLGSSPESKPALVNILSPLSSSYELLNQAVKNVYLLYQTPGLPCVIRPSLTPRPLSLSICLYPSVPTITRCHFFGLHTIALNVVVPVYFTR